MPDPLRVETGWPAPALSPNARPNRWDKAHAVRVAKKEGYAMALVGGALHWPGRHHDGRFKLTIHAAPAVERGRDDDNLIASTKAHRDGIAAALKVDDKRFDTQPLIWLPQPRDKRARLTFMIEPVP